MFACIPDPNPNTRGELIGPIDGTMCLYAFLLIVAYVLISAAVVNFNKSKEE